MNRQPINIWTSIQKLRTSRYDFVFENSKMVGIHNIEYEDIVDEINFLIKKLQEYKCEMESIYSKSFINEPNFKLSKIYIFYDYHTGFYKIGRSKNPRVREKTLMAQKPTIKKLFVSPLTNASLENFFHKKFKKKRLRGEWFDLNENDVEYIKNYNYGIN